MPVTNKIVVGVDGSACATHALRWALKEARLRGDAVEAIHIWHISSVVDISGMVPDSFDTLHECAQEVLAAVIAEVQAEAEGVELTSRIVQGAGAATLIEASADADLLVVGRRGHGGFLSLVMGSVAAQVAGHAHCPVVVVAPS